MDCNINKAGSIYVVKHVGTHVERLCFDSAFDVAFSSTLCI